MCSIAVMMFRSVLTLHAPSNSVVHSQIRDGIRVQHHNTQGQCKILPLKDTSEAGANTRAMCAALLLKTNCSATQQNPALTDSDTAAQSIFVTPWRRRTE